jgi:hypothetical protein
MNFSFNRQIRVVFRLARFLPVLLLIPILFAPATRLSPQVAQAQSSYIDCSITSVGFTPLMDMTASQNYHGEEGGLYGDGQNQAPETHLRMAYEASLEVVPRGSKGIPTPDGKIGVISIGMSNARAEFGAFVGQSNKDSSKKSDSVVLINGAQPGKVAWRWAYPDPADDPWQVLADTVSLEGLTKQQVQVVWLLEANDGPNPTTDAFPVYAEKLRDDMAVIVKRVKTDYPNVKLVYLSSRIYAGYSLIHLSPEPFAYEGAFSNRWLIQDQMSGGGATGVTYKNAPVLMWGPYLWADGLKPRSDGLIWLCDDLKGDGVHPSDSGQAKVAGLLTDFFTTDPYASYWFTGAAETPTPPELLGKRFVPLLMSNR